LHVTDLGKLARPERVSSHLLDYRVETGLELRVESAPQEVVATVCEVPIAFTRSCGRPDNT